jgi:hypothetical protein
VSSPEEIDYLKATSYLEIHKNLEFSYRETSKKSKQVLISEYFSPVHNMKSMNDRHYQGMTSSLRSSFHSIVFVSIITCGIRLYRSILLSRLSLSLIESRIK